ncbi:MAG TPA: hypothetical protein VI462_14320 [Acidimicrobiia bacterium]
MTFDPDIGPPRVRGGRRSPRRRGPGGRPERRYLPRRQEGRALATNPDPTLKLATSTGVTRTLDDWTTMFHLCLVVLPARPEGAAWVPVGERIFKTFGDADCHCAFVVPAGEAVARRMLGGAEQRVMTFVDPDTAVVSSLGLERLPAFVHLRQDTTVVAASEGWDPHDWQRVAREVGKAMAWTVPEVAAPGDPRPSPGWPVSGA